jgi:PAS domain S-box-containing protein
MTLNFYIDFLDKEYPRQCLVLTTPFLEKPHPQIIWVNEAFEKLTGYTLAELKGNSPRALQGNATDRATLDRLKKTLQDGLIFEGSILNYRKDGTPFKKAWRIAPILDEQGKLVYYFAVHQEMKPEDQYESIMWRVAEIQKDILGKLETMTKKPLYSQFPASIMTV